MRDELRDMIAADFEAALSDVPTAVLLRDKRISCIVAPATDAIVMDERGVVVAREVEIVGLAKDFENVRWGDTLSVIGADGSVRQVYVVQGISRTKAIITLRASMAGKNA